MDHQTTWLSRFANGLARFFHRRRLIRWGVVLSLFVLLFLFRFSIMRGMAGMLISVDELEKVDYCFILGGSSADRGLEGARLFHEGWVGEFICTGENVPSVLEIVGDSLTEAQLTGMVLRSNGIPSEKIKLINRSTSTREEAAVIHEYCLRMHMKKVMILSSKYHTSRVRSVFEEEFEGSDIRFIIHGAPSLKYNEFRWWESEEGMIAFNNEWMKKIYYWVK